MNRAKAKRMRHGPGPTEVFGAEPAKRRVNLRLVTMLAMILVVAGGVIWLSVAVQDNPAARAGTPSFGRTIPPLANSSGILNPRPNQYDPVTDRYWHAPAVGNAHWHQGPPPAGGGTVTPGFGTTTVVNSGSLSNLNPSIPNPTPGQYDPVTNRYWHAPVGGNAHWHNGRPPAEGGTTTTLNSGSSSANPDIPNPTPGQYDPVTNRYWHAPVGGNAHWHNGRPPAEGNP